MDASVEFIELSEDQVKTALLAIFKKSIRDDYTISDIAFKPSGGVILKLAKHIKI